MTNHPIEQEELMAYLDGELPSDRAGVAAGHLEHCRECQALAADLQSASRRMTEWQVEPASEELGPTLVTALEGASARPRPRARWTSRWVLGLASVGLLLLVLISVTPRVGHLPRSRPQLTSYLVAPATMIARTAQLTLNTTEFDKSRTALEDILKRHNGYLGQLNLNAPTGAGRTLDATLTIPVAQRDPAIAEIKKLGRVETESQTGEEVTAQFVDLEARLSNTRNTEQRLAGILRQRTGKLADVLAVEQEISRVRGEIEQMEAEKKSLTKRVEFLTLQVRLAENYRAPDDSVSGRLRNAAMAGYKGLFDGLVAAILFLLKYGPSILIWAALLCFPARFAWRRLRRG